MARGGRSHITSKVSPIRPNTLHFCMSVQHRQLGYFITFLHSTPQLWGPRRNTVMTFGTEKLEWWIYQVVRKV